MNHLNSVLVEGHLVKDPEFKIISDTEKLLSFTVALNRYYQKNNIKEKETSFFEIECWNRIAVNYKTLVKGDGIRVVGRLKQERWQDAEGNQFSKVKIIAESIEVKPNFNRRPDEVEQQ